MHLFFLGMQAHDTCYSPDLAVSLANNLLPKFSTNSLYCNDTQQIFLGKYHFSMMAKAFGKHWNAISVIQPITRRQILDSSKLKEFADDNFNSDENGRKLSKRVENTVGKGEIAHYEQFLLFPQCFQMVCLPGASKGVIVWEWVKLGIVWYIHVI